VQLALRIGDPVKTNGSIKQVVLRTVLFGQTGFRLPAQGEDLGRLIPDNDEFEVKMNGVILALATRDKDWKDPQIFSPWPQPISGGGGTIL